MNVTLPYHLKWYLDKVQKINTKKEISHLSEISFLLHEECFVKF